MPQNLNSVPREFGGLNYIRKHKHDLFTSLTPLEVNILDNVMTKNGSVFGGRPRTRGENEKIVLHVDLGRASPRHKARSEDVVVEGAQKTLDGLVKAGWLRYAASPVDSKVGYFWPTDHAKTVWDAMNRARYREW